MFRFKRLIAVLSILGTLAGGVILTAGAASAGEVPQPVSTSQFRVPRPEPVQFNFCTRADRRLLFRLLFLQRLGVHLNRFQRFELRFLERVCFNDDDDFGFPFPGPFLVR